MITLDGLKILVVDDERFMRATTKAVLRAVGRVLVTEADDGDAALIQVEQFHPDIVLCDVAMTRIGGLRFVELLRKHPEAQVRDTPVIMLSGHAEQQTIVAAAKLGINGYLIKPISPKQLGDELRNVLAMRRALPPT